MDRVRTPVELHHVGATVRHASPFADLAVPVSDEPIGEALRNKWVSGTPNLSDALRRGELPLYMHLLGGTDAEAIQKALASLRDEINSSVVTSLLSYFDWRPRLVGAWLSALRGMRELDDHIGRLLVRSDVCFAGKGYCLALARFNTDRARDYLVSYLEYYLGRPELWFEQHVAMAALVYLDQRSGRKDVARVRDAWERFRQRRPGDLAEDLETMGARFGMRVRQVERISALLWPGS